MVFKDNLEMKLLKDFFKKRAKQNQSENFDCSKRKLLGTIGKGLGAAAITATIPTTLFSKEAQANTIQVTPGIANCRDSAVKELYIYFHKHTWDDYYNTNSEESATWGMNFIGKERPRSIFVNVKEDTPFKEPAYYFLAEEMSMGRRVPIFNEIKKQNPPLAFFSNAINMYFTTWVRKEKDLNKYIEQNFLKSIFTASGRTENDVEGYLKMNQGEKKKFLNGLMANLQHRTYEDKLCVAWSSFFLTDQNYKLFKKGEKTMLTYKHLEYPSKRILGYGIRNSPNYDRLVYYSF